MSEAVLNAACDYIFQSGTTAGICFFGGEPLLEKDLLQKAVTRCQQHATETGIPFQCKMTTNGTLLDKAFIQYAKSIGMHIGLSFDGTGKTAVGGIGTAAEHSPTWNAMQNCC